MSDKFNCVFDADHFPQAAKGNLQVHSHGYHGPEESEMCKRGFLVTATETSPLVKSSLLCLIEVRKQETAKRYWMF